MSGASRYPISQFLELLIEQFGPSRLEFVQAIGYRNIERGLRRLDPWVDEGKGFDLILKQIAKKYPDQAAGLEGAIAATQDMKGAESNAAFLEACQAEHESFTPFIHAVGQTTRPSGITIFGMTGGFQRWNTIPLPKTILDLPLEQQLRGLPQLMNAYKLQYQGFCPFFGNLKGFHFVRLIDHFRFDVNGNLIERVNRPFRQGWCWVELR